MPYINQRRRDEIDYIVKEMEEQKIVADGDLNYLLFKYAKYNIPRSYNSLKNYIGELRQCATEIEREILGPYEETKKAENGIV
jgi:hypothetical protein